VIRIWSSDARALLVAEPRVRAPGPLLVCAIVASTAGRIVRHDVLPTQCVVFDAAQSIASLSTSESRNLTHPGSSI